MYFCKAQEQRQRQQQQQQQQSSAAASAAAAAAVLGGSVVGGSVVGLHFLSCLLGGDTLSFLLPLYPFIVAALPVHRCGPISEKK